jgi:hypothetical protein
LLFDEIIRIFAKNISMKTVICISIDTDSKTPISINKPEDVSPPTTPEEAKEVITNDIQCLAEALCFMVGVAEDNGYVNGNETLTKLIVRLNKDLK